MNEQRNIKNFKELGNFLKKTRRASGQKLDKISKHLIIKKQILHDIEEGVISREEFSNKVHLKGFLNSYIKFLKVKGDFSIQGLFSERLNDIKDNNIKFNSTKTEHSTYGSLIILSSLIILTILYLLWNKDTYYKLYDIGLLL